MKNIFSVLCKLFYFIYKFFHNIFFKKIFYLIVLTKSKQIGHNLKINGLTLVTNNTIIGNNVSINGLHVKGRGGNVVIGDNVHIGQGTKIINEYHNYNNGKTIPYDATYYYKDVIIRDNVWIAEDVIILGGVEIGEGAIIKIGSVVAKNVPPLAIAGGHPALPYKYRDREHYYKLKNEKKFF